VGEPPEDCAGDCAGDADPAPDADGALTEAGGRMELIGCDFTTKNTLPSRKNYMVICLI
jgi:hypothetical protein